MSNTYNIKKTANQNNIVLGPYHVDGPSSPTTALPIQHDSYPSATNPSTSLVFYGKGIANYGEKVQQNILNLLENFANPIAPVYPITGQLWFNTTKQELQIYYNNDWHNTIDGSLGGTINGQLKITQPPTDPIHAATKSYVDSIANDFRVGQIGALHSSFNTSTSVLTLSLGLDTTSVAIPTTSGLSLTANFETSTGILTLGLSNGSSVIVDISDNTPLSILSTYTETTGVLNITLSNGSQTSVTLPELLISGTHNNGIINLQLSNGNSTSIDISGLNTASDLSVSTTYSSITGILTTALSNGRSSTATIPSIQSLDINSSVANNDLTISLSNGNETTITLPIIDIVDITSSIINNQLTIALSNGNSTSVQLPNLSNINITSAYSNSTNILDIGLSNGSSTSVQLPSLSSIDITSTYNSTTDTLDIALSNGNSAQVTGFQQPAVVTRTLINSIGQTLFTIPQYVVGSNRLWVFKNGLKQYLGAAEDYVETSSTQITFLQPVPIGTKVEFLFFE